MVEHDLNLDKAGQFKSNKTKNLKPLRRSRSQRLRQASRAPQAVIKVVSYASGTKRVAATLDYVSRGGDLVMEDETGMLINGKEEIKEVLADWAQDFGQQTKMNKGASCRDSMHMILSTPNNTDETATLRAVKDFMEKEFSKNHQYLFTVHNDTDNPHAHVVVKTKGFDGKYLRTNKRILQQWRESFAEKLMEHGIEADSSSRLARGVGTRRASMVLNKTLENYEKGREKTDAENRFVKRIKDDLDTFKKTGKIELTAWEVKAKRITELEKQAFRDEAEAIRREAEKINSKDEKALLNEQADTLKKYGESIPEPKSKREQVLEQLVELDREATNTPNKDIER